MSKEPMPHEVVCPVADARPTRGGPFARLRAIFARPRVVQMTLAVLIWYLLAFVVLRDGIRYATFAAEIAHVPQEDTSICYLYAENDHDPSQWLLDALSNGDMPVERGSRTPTLRREDDYAARGPSDEDALGCIIRVKRIVPILPFLTVVDTSVFQASLSGCSRRHVLVGITPFWAIVHTRLLTIS